VVVVGAGPAGIAAAVEAADAGAAVTLIEASHALGGQFALAGRAPAHHEAWTRWSVSLRTRLTAGRVEVRLGELVTPARAQALLGGLGGGRGGLLLATGARPFLPPGLGRQVQLGKNRAAVVDAWDAIARPESVEGPVVVADWGGGWTGLDAAEVLAAAGRPVTLACAAAGVGEGVHQYQRNLYLARLDRLGVRLVQHCELVAGDGRVSFRHVFSGRALEAPEAATLVLSLGRAPRDELWSTLEGRPNVKRIGDVLGPRSAEEAVLEGAQAGARLAG
jgi:pyruvate/2-oxoglutarate dehydrogenase complex dihydrolipoamide dehydrogenase (E3) component